MSVDQRSAAQCDRAQQLASAIWSTWQDQRLLHELPPELAPRSLAEGAAAQEALVELIGEPVGWKLAATSPAGQRHIGVPGPIPGRLFSRFSYPSGAELSSTGMHMSVVEAEFVFRVGEEPAGEGPPTAEQLRRAMSGIHLAIELPDSRFEQFEAVGPMALLADDACAGRFVLGPDIGLIPEDDLVNTATHILVNGDLAASGSGANVLSGPWNALAWLAAALPSYGWSLKPGDIIFTGTTTNPVAVMPGDSVQADFGSLGSVLLSLSLP